MAIELIGYCEVGKGGSREMEADVYNGGVWFASIDVKRRQPVDVA